MAKVEDESEVLAWWVIRFVLENYVWPDQRKDALKTRSDEIVFTYKHLFGPIPKYNIPVNFNHSWSRCLEPRCFRWFADEIMALHGFPTSCFIRPRVVEWNKLSIASLRVRALIDPELFAANVVWWEHSECEVERRKTPPWLQEVARAALVTPKRVKYFRLPWRSAEARSNPEVGIYLM